MEDLGPQEPNFDDLKDFIFGVHPLNLIIYSAALVFWCLIVYIIQGGLFSKIEVKTVEPKRGPMTIAYKSGKGPYKGAGDLFSDITSILLDCNCIGIYYDDPDSVASQDLRYAVGAILASGSEVPDPEKVETCVKHGYKIIHFPQPNHVVLAEFPFRNTLSIYMGIFRVYPKLKEYIAVRGLCAYPALEIYTSSTIEFIMPLSKQEDFFVPEFCDEQVSIATTEFSNHPDQAAADEELKNEDDKLFVRPKPLPKKPSPKAETDSDDEDSSEFEKVEPET